MKSFKLASFATAFALAASLAACGAGTFHTDVDENGKIEITAEHATNPQTTNITSISVNAGECIVVNPLLESGSIHLTIEDGTGATKVFDGDVDGKIMFTVDAEPGIYEVVVSPSAATGTMSILTGDPEALGQADAALDELVESGQLGDEASSSLADAQAESAAAQDEADKSAASAQDASSAEASSSAESSSSSTSE